MAKFLFGSHVGKRLLSLVTVFFVTMPNATWAQDHDIVQIIKRNASNFAIDGNFGAANAQDIYLYREDEDNINQQWYEIDRGDGYYSYQKVGTDYCIDGGNGGERAQNVYLWRCNDNNQNQHWLKVAVDDNHYRLEKRNAPGFSIDGNNGAIDLQSIYLWSSNHSNQNQHWFFNVVTDESDSDVVETAEEAANFLLQATFGPTEESITELQDLGYSAWFRQQIDTDIDRYIDDAIRAEEGTTSSLARGRLTFNFWMDKAVNLPDQLRQRTVFALSEIISTATNQSPLWRKTQLHATFKDHFQFNAFGNYRDLLEDVTYSPLMGNWLTYVGNTKADPVTGSAPDENYAREILQLFTIGLVELNNDGTEKTTSDGNAIETYTQEDIVELAKVFTGLYWAETNFGSSPSQHTALPRDVLPMEMHNEYHSEGSKTFLGETVPDFGDGNRTISAALDIIFEHPNVGPFISRQLIQRFTTGHPSNEYIGRVATAFNTGEYVLPDGSDIGSGERGDMVPVLAAVLFDNDARSDSRFANDDFGTSWGKVREPIIRFVHWMRIANVTNIDIVSNNIFDPNWQFGQQPFNAPSVFNFFRPGYVASNTLTGDAGLTQPELQIATGTNLIGFFNRMRDYVTRSTDEDTYFVPADDYLREREILATGSVADLTDYLNLVYTANQMSDETWQKIHDAIDAIDVPSNNSFEALRQQAMVGTLLAVTSVESITQR